VTRLVALALLAFAGAGCAAFRGGELAPSTSWPPAPAAQRKTVSLILAGGTVTMNGAPTDAAPAMVAKWREEVQKAYVDSGLFSAVLQEGNVSDVRAEVRISDVGEGSQVLAFFCGFTMFLIPATANDRITMHTDFKNAEGDVLASIEKSDSMRLWMQTFLVFIMPFNWPGTVANDLFRDLTRATLEDAHAKQVL
jgi:hypothetical protein